MVLSLAPATSEAAFHVMKVREVYAGTAAGADGDFVELQMFTSGQNATLDHQVDVYDDVGVEVDGATLDSYGNGNNQQSILIGDAGTLPGNVAPDKDEPLDIPLTGGAVCFPDAQPPDCVTWGDFAAPPPPAFPNPQTENAPAILAGQSLTRSIATGCATLLEGGDDTDNSETDFAVTAPTPRNNSTAPTETACAAPPPDPPPADPPPPDPTPEPIVAPDLDPPETTIDKAPKKELAKPRTSVEFSSDEVGSRFECKIGKDRFKACTSPHKVKGLEKGKTKFQVRAIDAAGNADPTPAKATIEVAKEKNGKGGKG